MLTNKHSLIFSRDLIRFSVVGLAVPSSSSSFADAITLTRLASVSRTFYTCSSSPSHWARVFHVEFGPLAAHLLPALGWELHPSSVPRPFSLVDAFASPPRRPAVPVFPPVYTSTRYGHVSNPQATRVLVEPTVSPVVPRPFAPLVRTRP